MKRVIVSQRVDVYPSRQETRDALDQRLVMFIAAAGGVAVPVPNALSGVGGLGLWLSSIQPDALILSGGNDIGECAERDATERMLLDYAQPLELPVLGICRGMQMMGVWNGGTLKAVAGHVRSRHQLTGDVTGDVNSYHNLSLVKCPIGFSVLACSEDGEIEAIRHDKLPWEGWMWHPERELKFSSRDIQRLKALIK